MKKYKLTVPFYNYERGMNGSDLGPCIKFFDNLDDAKKMIRRVEKVLIVAARIENTPITARNFYKESEARFDELVYREFGVYHDGIFTGNPVLTEVIEAVIN